MIQHGWFCLYGEDPKWMQHIQAAAGPEYCRQPSLVWVPKICEKILPLPCGKLMVRDTGA